MTAQTLLAAGLLLALDFVLAFTFKRHHQGLGGLLMILLNGVVPALPAWFHARRPGIPMQRAALTGALAAFLASATLLLLVLAAAADEHRHGANVSWLPIVTMGVGVYVLLASLLGFVAGLAAATVAKRPKRETATA